MRELLLPKQPGVSHYRHGYKTQGKYAPEYAVWNNLRSRCKNPKNNRYQNYGARGIKVCERWDEDFLNFLADMGRRPSPNHSIERINNDGNYEPANCRWAERKEQCRNRKTSRFLVLNGISRTAAEWAEMYGISQGTLHARLKSGWPVERAITTPIHGRVSKDGKTFGDADIHLNLREALERVGTTPPVWR